MPWWVLAGSNAGGSAPPTSPTDPTDGAVTGCYLWLEANNIPAVADATALSSWTDSSTGGCVVNQPTANMRPLFKTSRTPAGGPSVLFDGSNDVLLGTLGTASKTLFDVYVLARVSARRQFDALFSSSFVTGGTTLELDDGGGKIDIWLSNVGARAISGLSVIPANTWVILNFSYDGTTLVTRGLNTDSGSSVVAGVSMGTQFDVGGDHFGGFFTLQGEIACVAAYPYLGASNAGDRKTVYNAIATQHGVATV